MTQVDQIKTKFPQLDGHEDLIQFVLDVRASFKLEKAPFMVSVGDWSSGSLETYYYREQVERRHKQNRAYAKLLKKHKKPRRGSPGWKR